MDRTLVLIGRAHQGDKAARDLLFEENTGLIYSVAKRFLGRGVEMEDLFQIGSIGLLKAVDKFDMSYDVKFSTYAVPMIIGEIKRYLRDDGILKVSRSLKENHYRIYQVREALTRRLEREPTTGEMAEEMGISIEELVMTMESGAEACTRAAWAKRSFRKKKTGRKKYWTGFFWKRYWELWRQRSGG